MYRKSSIASVGVLLFFSFLHPGNLEAQVSLSAQLRTRTELRNGYGNLLSKGSDPSFFTSQRTRLNLGYKWSRLNFGLSIQDVRVWGQDASTISSADGNKLMLHEGWADLILFNREDTAIHSRFMDFLSVKIGRQELSYDDVRLLGNLDWLQQARRHDMLLIKGLHRGYQIDIGLAYNQNSDVIGVNGTTYVPANIPSHVKSSSGLVVPTPAGLIPLAPAGNAGVNSARSGAPVISNPTGTNGGNQDYKTFASVYVSRKFGTTKLSALFFNDNFGRYRIDSIGNETTGYVYGRRFVSAGATDKFNYSKTNHRFTYGLMVNHQFGSNTAEGILGIQAAYYVQAGRNRDGVKMQHAFHSTISAAFQKGMFTLTPGFDILSGNRSTTSEDEKFDPLYGTPHKHWGYMDYFYVGTGSPAGGLQNPYIKTKFATQKFSITMDIHHFRLHRSMRRQDGSYISRQLGNELDLVANYGVNKFTNLELGYSLMLATSSMAVAKGQAGSNIAAESVKRNGTWFYAMLRFTPDFILGTSAITRK